MRIKRVKPKLFCFNLQKTLKRISFKGSNLQYFYFPLGFIYKGPLRPGKVTPMRFVPDDINKPDYFFTGTPDEEINDRLNSYIEIKTDE